MDELLSRDFVCYGVPVGINKTKRGGEEEGGEGGKGEEGREAAHPHKFS